MDLPLRKATRKQIASGTAPVRIRAPAKYWYGPDLWPDIAEAAIQTNWSPSAIIAYLRSTAAGEARFARLNRGTVWRWFDHTKKTGWSAQTLNAVESEMNHRVVLQPLGRPHMFVSPKPSLLMSADHCTFQGKTSRDYQQNRNPDLDIA